MSSDKATQSRERRKVHKLILRDESAHPDHRFVERYAESALIEDAAILAAWTPRLLVPVRVETAARR